MRSQKLFLAAPSSLIRPIAGEGQERFVRMLISRLREDAEYASVAHYAEELEQQQVSVNEAIARRNDLYPAEAKVQTNRRLALDQARRLRSRG